MKTLTQLLADKGLKDPKPSKFRCSHSVPGRDFYINGTGYKIKVPYSIGTCGGFDALGHHFKVQRDAYGTAPGSATCETLPASWLVDLNAHPMNTEETEQETVSIFD